MRHLGLSVLLLISLCGEVKATSWSKQLINDFSNLNLNEIQTCSSPIIGGEVVNPQNDSYKAVKQIFENKEQSCTATIIGEGIAITAAHCLDQVKPKDLEIELSFHKRVKINHFYPHPKYSEQKIGDPNDVAIITFSPGKVKEEFLELQFEKPSLNDPVELVGFGNGRILSDYGTKMDGAGIKRQGKNKISSFTDTGQIEVSSENNGAAAIAGDSGGPLIRGGKIIGIVSGTAYSKDRQATTTYTALSSKEVQEFIQKTLEKISHGH